MKEEKSICVLGQPEIVRMMHELKQMMYKSIEPADSHQN